MPTPEEWNAMRERIQYHAENMGRVRADRPDPAVPLDADRPRAAEVPEVLDLYFSVDVDGPPVTANERCCDECYGEPHRYVLASPEGVATLDGKQWRVVPGGFGFDNGDQTARLVPYRRPEDTKGGDNE